MSRFKTPIKVDIEAAKAALPKNAYVHNVTLDEKAGAVTIEWSHDAFTTPYTFPTEFPLATLKKRGAPEGVTVNKDLLPSVPPKVPSEA